MIDRIQKLLGIDLRYYLSGGGYLLISQIAPLLLLFASTWFLTNFLSKEVYGYYSYVQNLLGMLSVFTLPGYYNAVIKSSARGFHGSLKKSAKRRLAFSLIGTAILMVISVYFWAKGDSTRASGILLGSVFLGLAFGLDDFRAFLNGRNKYALFTLFHVGLQLAVTVATVTALLISGNYLVILTVNLAVRGLGQLLCMVLSYRTRENDNIEEGFVKFGYKLSALSALGTISFYLDRVLVGTIFSAAMMAEFNLASIITTPLRNIGVVINRLIFPKMVNLEGRRFALKTFFKAFYLIGALTVIGLIYFLLIPIILRWLFPIYENIRPYVNWMMASELVAVVVIYLETYYLSQDNLLKTYYVVNIVRPAAIIVLLPILMYIFPGLYGAIFAKLFVRAAEALYLLARIFFGWDGLKEEPTQNQ